MNFETISDEEALWEAVLANPEDSLSRLALANYHEQTGDNLTAECWRWLANKERTPSYESHAPVNRHLHYWWNGDCPKSHLPRHLIYSMDDEIPNLPWVYDSMKQFNSCKTSYDALVTTWKTLTEEQRKQCWDWNP